LSFFKLFVPALVHFVVLALLMHLALPSGRPAGLGDGGSKFKEGGLLIVGLLFLTIVTAVSFHIFPICRCSLT
jgi:hypothetical protein